MQCPACNYEPTLSEHASSPDQCPSCGRFYAKAKAAAARPASADKEAAERKRLAAQRSNRGASTPASPVTVVDLQMPFISMVVFMVKWALASIPALIILAAAGTVAFTMLGAMLGPG